MSVFDCYVILIVLSLSRPPYTGGVVGFERSISARALENGCYLAGAGTLVEMFQYT